MATMLRAVLDTSPHSGPGGDERDFLRVARPETGPGRRSPRSSRARPRPRPGRRCCRTSACVLDTTITTGTLGDPGDGGLCWTGEPAGVLPPVGECAGFADASPGGHQAHRLRRPGRTRLGPGDVGLAARPPRGDAGDARIFPVARGAPARRHLLALAVDALPPVIFGIARGGWSPTVELTWHMRAVPAPGLLRLAAGPGTSAAAGSTRSPRSGTRRPPGRAEPPDRPGGRGA